MYGMTEILRDQRVNGYQEVWGWTQSRGQSAPYGYSLPDGFVFDGRYSDEYGGTGTHGGCSRCVMTLVHIISATPGGEVAPVDGGTDTEAATPGGKIGYVYAIIAIIVAYMVIRR